MLGRVTRCEGLIGAWRSTECLSSAAVAADGLDGDQKAAADSPCSGAEVHKDDEKRHGDDLGQHRWHMSMGCRSLAVESQPGRARKRTDDHRRPHGDDREYQRPESAELQCFAVPPRQLLPQLRAYRFLPFTARRAGQSSWWSRSGRFGLKKYEFHGKKLVNNMLYVPIIVPGRSSSPWRCSSSYEPRPLPGQAGLHPHRPLYLLYPTQWSSSRPHQRRRRHAEEARDPGRQSDPNLLPGHCLASCPARRPLPSRSPLADDGHEQYARGLRTGPSGAHSLHEQVRLYVNALNTIMILVCVAGMP